MEVRKLLSRLIGRIRRHWPNTCITIRGDGHYGREEAMTWCETYGIDYIFGLSGNVVLDRLVEAAADDIRVRRAESQAEVLRGFAETRYAAKSWDKERRVVARIEASASHADDMLRRGIDIRYVVTSLPDPRPSQVRREAFRWRSNVPAHGCRQQGEHIGSQVLVEWSKWPQPWIGEGRSVAIRDAES